VLGEKNITTHRRDQPEDFENIKELVKNHGNDGNSFDFSSSSNGEFDLMY
jgi:hypothetical protein